MKKISKPSFPALNLPKYSIPTVLEENRRNPKRNFNPNNVKEI